jgi:hypothetical protein
MTAQLAPMPYIGSQFPQNYGKKTIIFKKKISKTEIFVLKKQGQ